MESFLAVLHVHRPGTAYWSDPATSQNYFSYRNSNNRDSDIYIFLSRPGSSLIFIHFIESVNFACGTFPPVKISSTRLTFCLALLLRSTSSSYKNAIFQNVTRDWSFITRGYVILTSFCKK